MNDDHPFSVYLLKNSSPHVFGRVVFIVALGNDSKDDAGRKELVAESFVLLERNSVNLLTGRVASKPINIKEAGLVVDAKYMLKAALELCQSVVADLLHGKFQRTDDWTFFATPFAYEKVGNEFLGLMWGVGVFRGELEKIKDKTTCAPLNEVLTHLSVLNVRVEKPTTDEPRI